MRQAPQALVAFPDRLLHLSGGGLDWQVQLTEISKLGIEVVAAEVVDGMPIVVPSIEPTVDGGDRRESLLIIAIAFLANTASSGPTGRAATISGMDLQGMETKQVIDRTTIIAQFASALMRKLGLVDRDMASQVAFSER